MSIEENTVLLVIDAMNGCVVIVVVAVVMKIQKIVTMTINKLTLKHTERSTNKLVNTQGCLE